MSTSVSGKASITVGGQPVDLVCTDLKSANPTFAMSTPPSQPLTLNAFLKALNKELGTDISFPDSSSDPSVTIKTLSYQINIKFDLSVSIDFTGGWKPFSAFPIALDDVELSVSYTAGSGGSAPTITSINGDASGAATGAVSSTLTIVGTNLSGTTKVTIGSTAISTGITNKSATQISVKLPSSYTSTTPETITVTTSVGTSTASSATFAIKS